MSFIELSWTRSSLLLLYHCSRVVIIIVIVIIIFFLYDCKRIRLNVSKVVWIIYSSFIFFPEKCKIPFGDFCTHWSLGWDTAHQACTTFISTIITSLLTPTKIDIWCWLQRGVKGKLPNDGENHYVDHSIIKLQAKIFELNFYLKPSDLQSNFTPTMGYLNPALKNLGLVNYFFREADPCTYSISVPCGEIKD